MKGVISRMTKKESEESINKKIIDFCKEQISLLDNLYKLPWQTLKNQENQTLAGITLDIMHKLENLIPSILEETEVKYAQIVWGNIQSNLEPLSFSYIDWESFQANSLSGKQLTNGRKTEEPKDSYQRNITGQDMQRFKEDGSILIAAGGLCIGSIVFLIFHIGPKLIWSVGLIAATATAGVVIFRNIFSSKEKRQQASHLNKSQQSTSQESKIDLEPVIKSVCKKNKTILIDWGQKLAEATLCAWQEAEKK